MADWDAEKFYEENEESEASFLVGTTPIHTDLRSYLSLVLKQILAKGISGYMFRGTVHTVDGDVELSTDQYNDLLRIQERKDKEELAG